MNVILPSATRPIGGSQGAMPSSYFGQPGYYRVPESKLFGNISGWPVTVDSTGQVFVIDPNGLKFAVSINHALEMVFFRPC